VNVLLAILGLLKSVPIMAKLAIELEKQLNEIQAARRRRAKDERVRAALEQFSVPQAAPKAEQQRSADETGGVQGSSNSIT
jgi:hypothetical protein